MQLLYPSHHASHPTPPTILVHNTNTNTNTIVDRSGRGRVSNVYSSYSSHGGLQSLITCLGNPRAPGRVTIRGFATNGNVTVSVASPVSPATGRGHNAMNSNTITVKVENYNVVQTSSQQRDQRNVGSEEFEPVEWFGKQKCYTGDETKRRFTIGVAVSFRMFRRLGCDYDMVAAFVASIFANANKLYEKQFNLVLEPSTIVIMETSGGPTWNDVDACANVGTQLERFGQWG